MAGMGATCSPRVVPGSAVQCRTAHVPNGNDGDRTASGRLGIKAGVGASRGARTVAHVRDCRAAEVVARLLLGRSRACARLVRAIHMLRTWGHGCVACRAVLHFILWSLLHGYLSITG